MDSTQQLYIKSLWFKIFCLHLILNHPSNVVAQLTKMCRPVGCRPVRLSPSRLSPNWFVAQMTVHRKRSEATQTLRAGCSKALTNTQTDRGDYNTLCSLARSVTSLTEIFLATFEVIVTYVYCSGIQKWCDGQWVQTAHCSVPTRVEKLTNTAVAKPQRCITEVGTKIYTPRKSLKSWVFFLPTHPRFSQEIFHELQIIVAQFIKDEFEFDCHVIPKHMHCSRNSNSSFQVFFVNFVKSSNSTTTQINGDILIIVSCV